MFHIRTHTKAAEPAWRLAEAQRAAVHYQRACVATLAAYQRGELLTSQDIEENR